MSTVGRRVEWLRGPWAERLIWLSLMALPFQQAFTVDVGFPLKISELFGATGVVAAVLEKGNNVRKDRAYLLPAVLAVLVIMSALRAAMVPATGGDETLYPRGLAQDLILYTGYAIFAIAYCLAISISMRRKWIRSAFTVGVLASVVYSVLQFVLWKIEVPLLSEINGTLQWGSAYNVLIPRNGPFLEGNYLGFYAVTALFILAHARAWIGFGGAVVLLLYSQSTVAFIAAIFGLAVGILLRPRLRTILICVAVVLVSAGIVFVVAPLRSIANVAFTKLGFIPNELGAQYGLSLSGRTTNTIAGFSMALDNPVLGVGPGRYGYFYGEHVRLLDHAASVTNSDRRPIANNVYAQIAAEVGLVALIVFIAVLFVLLLRARRNSIPAVAAVLALAVGAVAFPAWTALTFWGVIGTLFVLSRTTPGDNGMDEERAKGVDSGECHNAVTQAVADDTDLVTQAVTSATTRRQMRTDRLHRKGS